MQMQFWALCAAAASLAGWSSFADRRRLRRADPDRVGFVSWPLVLMLSLLVALVSAALAIKG